ncbi:hypothetical protein AMAG_20093 [Allomyces macrogynus ATCC 38327]|uniref:Uncharacterized protein n=1 Tax=Allomyces macrogynus (strain ATCC 38327) TaxID=578462 RepID=A0A0L0T6C0_ALLM3|nr:hypothetical protein AMAG_20093 [Allomyces macrogynus ATCC 38327]|eukprot:KNE70343.1 hypothetical protein AMAG_20093 [Allomyces macrogynus ATCC 38327]
MLAAAVTNADQAGTMLDLVRALLASTAVGAAKMAELSVDAARVLARVFARVLAAGELRVHVAYVSRELPQAERSALLKQFRPPAADGSATMRYMHHVGLTARAGPPGVAVALLASHEVCYSKELMEKRENRRAVVKRCPVSASREHRRVCSGCWRSQEAPEIEGMEEERMEEEERVELGLVDLGPSEEQEALEALFGSEGEEVKGQPTRMCGFASDDGDEGDDEDEDNMRVEA